MNIYLGIFVGIYVVCRLAHLLFIEIPRARKLRAFWEKEARENQAAVGKAPSRLQK